MPRVAVVLPVYNGAKYVAEAVRSVLSQTFSDFELIVVDDGSTDRTAEILAGFADARLRVLRFPENRGIVSALNSGIRESGSELIARMDADDVCMPRRLERQVQFMDAHPEVMLCGTYCQQFGDDGVAVRPPVDAARIRARLFFGLAVIHPSVLMRRAFLEAHGLRYDEAFPHTEDFDLFVRAAERGDLANVPEILVRTRAHPEEVSVVFVQEQSREAARIFVRQLRGLLPGASVEEEQFHLDFLLGPPAAHRDRVEHWLLRLGLANRACERFDADAFEAELRQQWSRFHRETSAAGLRTLVSYWRSPLAERLTDGLANHLELAARCALAVPLRWRRAIRKAAGNRGAGETRARV